VEKFVEAPASAVWAVLADGWLYANWVVGASRIRAVDAGWPEPGCRIHHSVGLWPALIDDTTEVLEVDPERLLRLQARAWPAGEAHVEITLRDDGPSRCIIRIEEDAIAGPGKLIPHAVRQFLIVPRNRETVKRLALIAAGRHRRPARLGRTPSLGIPSPGVDQE
jgi:hypothetical protein